MARLLLFVVLGLVGLLLAMLLAIQRPAIATRVVNAVLARAATGPRAVLSVREARGNWLTAFELRGLRWMRGDTLLAGVDTLRARYQLTSLFAGRLDVRNLETAGVVVSAEIAETTAPTATSPPPALADLLRGRFYRGPSLRIDRIAVRDGRYHGRSQKADSGFRLARIRLAARDVRLGGRFSFHLDSLGARILTGGGSGRPMDVRLAASLNDGRLALGPVIAGGNATDLEARGGLALDGGDSLAEVSLTLRAQPIALEDLAAFIPLRCAGSVSLALELSGPRPDRLSGAVTLATERVDVGPVSLGSSRLDVALADGRAETHLVTVYERAPIRVDGWIRPLDGRPTYDLEARADQLPARIPGAPWWPALAGHADAAVALGVEGSGYARPVLEVTARADGAAGLVDLDAHLDFTGEFTWMVRRLGLQELDVARLLGDTTASAIDGSLTASGQGVDPTTRRMTAALHLAPSRYGRWRIATADARATLTGEQLGVSLRAETDAGTLEVDPILVRWDRDGAFQVTEARFHGLDLARMTGQEALASRIDGSVSIRGRGLNALLAGDASRARPSQRAPGSAGGPLAALRDGRVSADYRLTLAPSGFRDVAVSHARAQGSLAGGAVDLDLDLHTAAGRLDLEAAGRPFHPAPSFRIERARFTDLDLAAWTGVPALRSHLAGNVTGGTEAGGATNPGDASLAVQLERSAIGNVALGGGEARASWSRGRGRVASALWIAGDTVTATGEVSFDGNAPHGRLDGTLPLSVIAALAGRDSLAASGALVARLAWAGASPATSVIEGTVTGSGTIDLARLDSLFVRARLERGTLTLDTLTAVSNVAAIGGAGSVALFDSAAAAATDLRLLFAVRDASPLEALLGADTLAVGSGTIHGHLGGMPGARTLELGMSLRSLAWDRVRLLRADVSARGELDRDWRLDRAEAEAALSRLQALDVAVDEVTVRTAYRDGHVRYGLAATIDERHACRVGGHGRIDSIGVHLILDTLGVRADSVAWALAQPAHFDLTRDRMALAGLEVLSPRGHVRAGGVIDRRGDQSFHLDAEGVDLGLILAWMGRKDARGTLAGRLALEGPAASPSGSGSVRVDLASFERPSATLQSDMAWNGRRLDLAGGCSAAGGDSIAWRGHLPLAFSLAPRDTSTTIGGMRVLEGDVELRVAADQFPLRALSILLAPEAVGELDGTLDIDAHLTGSSHALVGSGTVTVTGGVLPLPGLGVTYRDLEMGASLQGDSLILHRAHVASDKGTLDASGKIRFVSLARVEPLLHVAARRFAVSQTSDLKASASADLDLSGTLTQPVVRGKVSLANTTITFKQSDLAVAGSTSTVRLTDADIRMMEEAFGYVRTPAPDMVLAFYDASDLDLGVALEGNCWLRQRVQPELSVALTGQFQLRKAPHGEPELFGRIAPVPGRGFVEQFARNFDITGGEVQLNGKPKDHTVSIMAQYKPPTSSESEESDVVVNLAVEGTVDRLRLTLSSEPAMSNAEIVNFIATGRSRVDPSTSGAEGSNLAKDIGMAQVSGIAEAAAQEAIGLDVLQVRFDALQGATLVSGSYLSPELYVGIRQPLQYKDTSSPTSTESYRTRYEVEYAIRRWLVVNLQGETSTLRSFFRARHAY